LGGVPANTVSISGSAVTNPITNKKAVNATSLMKIGYLLTGIDAGIIASDKWNVVRIPDATP